MLVWLLLAGLLLVAGWIIRHKFGPLWWASSTGAPSLGLTEEEAEILAMVRESRTAEEKAAAEKRKQEFRDKLKASI